MKRNLKLSFKQGNFAGHYFFFVCASNGRMVAVGSNHNRQSKARKAWESLVDAIKDGRVAEGR